MSRAQTVVFGGATDSIQGLRLHRFHVSSLDFCISLYWSTVAHLLQRTSRVTIIISCVVCSLTFSGVPAVDLRRQSRPLTTSGVWWRIPPIRRLWCRLCRCSFPVPVWERSGVGGAWWVSSWLGHQRKIATLQDNAKYQSQWQLHLPSY